MASSPYFKMRILEIFHFSNGQTVFVGPVEGTLSFLGPCQGRLYVKGLECMRIQLEGEMAPSSKHPDGHRSVSTLEKLPIDRETVLANECFLEAVLE